MYLYVVYFLKKKPTESEWKKLSQRGRIHFKIFRRTLAEYNWSVEHVWYDCMLFLFAYGDYFVWWGEKVGVQLKRKTCLVWLYAVFVCVRRLFCVMRWKGRDEIVCFMETGKNRAFDRGQVTWMIGFLCDFGEICCSCFSPRGMSVPENCLRGYSVLFTKLIPYCSSTMCHTI